MNRIRDKLGRFKRIYLDTKKHKIELSRIYYENHKEHCKENTRKRRLRILEKVRKLIGDKCILCGETKKLYYHEIYNKKHPCGIDYIYRHYKDFIPLCLKCHTTIHWILIKNIDMDILRTYVEISHGENKHEVR